MQKLPFSLTLQAHQMFGKQKWGNTMTIQYYTRMINDKTIIILILNNIEYIFFHSSSSYNSNVVCNTYSAGGDLKVGGCVRGVMEGWGKLRQGRWWGGCDMDFRWPWGCRLMCRMSRGVWVSVAEWMSGQGADRWRGGTRKCGLLQTCPPSSMKRCLLSQKVTMTLTGGY